MKPRGEHEVAFEDSISDDWSRDIRVAEVPIGNRPLFYLGIGIFLIVLVIGWQISYLNLGKGSYYQARAEDNVSQAKTTPAPRGVIEDRDGNVIAQDKAAFAAVLNVRLFINKSDMQTSTLAAAQTILGLSPDAVLALVDQTRANDFATPVVLADPLTQNQLVNLQAINLPTITIQSDFVRDYPNGPVFSSVVGYTGRVTAADLKANPKLTASDFIGKTGVEAFYDDHLRGIPGMDVSFENARGQVLGQGEKTAAQVGTPLKLTIDGGLQTYMRNRLQVGLQVLGRTIGFGVAMNPQTGEVLALVNLPGYNNNVFSQPSTSSTAIIRSLLTSPEKPLFDRVVSGYYNPGSTVKPLDGIALLKEGIVDPSRTIFSPGYLMVPNPYSSSTPTKYLDWRYQGTINLASAIAQSSDVYFYLTVGGSPISTPMLNDPSDYGISGLGINKLGQWWKTFGFGKTTGIDLPNESQGFLPTPDWKEAKTKKPWLLGDTYNVSIGQGDFLVSPLQLLAGIDMIANGGTVYRPYLNASSTPFVNKDLTYLLPEIQEVQKGMRLAVTSPLGTAYALHDLPFAACAKTGSAQIHDNSQENALFVGYASCENPQIAVLLLIENAREGSLNVVPVAKDVLNWYYENRLKK